MPGSIPWPYAAWLALVAIQRCVELWISRRHVAAARRAGRVVEAESRAAFARMVALHVGLIVLPPLEVVLLDREPPLALSLVAFALFALAQGLRYAALHALRGAWNARAIVDPARPLVTRGPYAWVRHPNYLAVCVEFVSVPLGGGAWLSALLLNLLHAPVLARRIANEERLLARAPGFEILARRPRLLPFLRARS